MLGVIGAGTMGNGIAQVFAAHGHDVVMMDVNGGRGRERGHAAVGKSLARFVKKETSHPGRGGRHPGAASPHRPSTADLASADLVVEAIVENEAIKTTLFAELDAVVQPDAILASNTSSIWITKIAAATKRPDKVIGMHFMNPVPLMKLIEVIRGQDTSDDTTQKVFELAREPGQDAGRSERLAGLRVQPRSCCRCSTRRSFCVHEGVATPSPSTRS